MAPTEENEYYPSKPKFSLIRRTAVYSIRVGRISGRCHVDFEEGTPSFNTEELLSFMADLEVAKVHMAQRTLKALLQPQEKFGRLPKAQEWK